MVYVQNVLIIRTWIYTLLELIKLSEKDERGLTQTDCLNSAGMVLSGLEYFWKFSPEFCLLLFLAQPQTEL